MLETLKRKNYNCSICEQRIHKISPTKLVTLKTKIDWEFDSTLFLSGLVNPKCFLGFCSKCLLISHYPLFDTNKLYTSKGFKVRKIYFEKYNKKTYGLNPHENNFKYEIMQARNEFMRFKKISNFILKNLKNFKKKKINILDYGGGDGYISNCFKTIFEANSNIKVLVNNFDPLKWKKSKNKIKFKKFDFVIISHVLEHISFPKKVINLIKQKLLTDNGFIFVEVPDERLRFIKLLFTKKIGLHYHVTHHTRNSLERLFNKCNFHLIKTSYLYNSSYRGESIKSIICIAQNSKIEIKNDINKSVINYIYEFFSLIMLIFFSMKKYKKIFID